jgi:hypothetical protein
MFDLLPVNIVKIYEFFFLKKILDVLYNLIDLPIMF